MVNTEADQLAALAYFADGVTEEQADLFCILIPELVDIQQMIDDPINPGSKIPDPEHTPDIMLLNSEQEIKIWIGIAKRIHAIDELATIYCAAHLLTLRNEEAVIDDGGNRVATGTDGGQKTIQSETMGKHTIQYVTTSLSTAADAESATSLTQFFSSTPYGRFFLVLERRATALIAPIFA